MTKKHFIALADSIKEHNSNVAEGWLKSEPFDEEQLKTIAGFCYRENNRFDRQLWFDYIAGNCGPDGGKLNACTHGRDGQNIPVEHCLACKKDGAR